MIADVRAAGGVVGVVLVHPHHKRDLKQELLDAAPLAGVDNDEEVVGFVQGCMITSHPDVPINKAWVLPKNGVRDRVSI